jgi:hypothetical protein
MSNATWFDSWPSQLVSGSYSGYNSSAQPIIIPYACKLGRVFLIFRRARYDWRSSAGPIYFEFGFYTMDYNDATDYCRIGVELPGTFSGSDTGEHTLKYDITDLSVRVGENLFSPQDIVGVQFRKDTSQPGQIYSIYDPLVLLLFDGV